MVTVNREFGGKELRDTLFKMAVCRPHTKAKLNRCIENFQPWILI